MRLEEERRRWQSQMEVGERAMAEERAQAISMLDDQHKAAMDLAESQIATLSEALHQERAAHVRALDEQSSELASRQVGGA